jgi:hypothetical protein
MDQIFKVAQVEGGRDELVARAAYDTALSLWPKAVIELRQGTRVMQKSGE